MSYLARRSPEERRKKNGHHQQLSGKFHDYLMTARMIMVFLFGGCTSNFRLVLRHAKILYSTSDERRQSTLMKAFATLRSTAPRPVAHDVRWFGCFRSTDAVSAGRPTSCATRMLCQLR